MNTALLSEWTPVCNIGDIPTQGARIVKRAGHDDIAVFRTSDDRIFAIVDCCPHKGGPLSCGLVHGHAVTCPLHSWTINLEDGQAHAPDEGWVHKIAVRVDGERIYLNLSTQG